MSKLPEMKKMKESLFKKLIAILLALATFILAGCQNNESVNEENPSENISQNDENATDNNTDESKAPIDLTKVDLSQYGISSNNKISEPYETPKGNFYYVCDYDAGEKDEFNTYRFFTTDEDVMYAETGTLVTDSFISPFEYKFYDINNDGVEELIVHEKIHTEDFNVFTFKEGEMLFVGTIFDDHGSLYARDDIITAVSREWVDHENEDAGPYSMYFTYKLLNDEIVEVGCGSCVPISELDDSQFGQELAFTEWQKG
jgi:hypothetical protein